MKSLQWICTRTVVGVCFLLFSLANLVGKVTPIGANKLIIAEHGMNSSSGIEALCELVWHALERRNYIGNPLKRI